MMEVRTNDAAHEKKESFDGQIVALIHSRIFDVDDKGNVTKKAGADAPDFKDSEPCEALAIPKLAEFLNDGLPDKKKVDPRWLGKQCRSLGFLTKEITKASPYRKKSAIVSDQASIKRVFANFSLPIPQDFDPAHPACEAKPNSDNDMKMPDQIQIGIPFENSSGIDIQQETNDLTNHAGCAGSDFPDYCLEESAWPPSGYTVPQEIWPADWKAPWDEDRNLAAIAE
jgi:hypothetical protein